MSHSLNEKHSASYKKLWGINTLSGIQSCASQRHFQSYEAVGRASYMKVENMLNVLDLVQKNKLSHVVSDSPLEKKIKHSLKIEVSSRTMTLVSYSPL